MAKEIKKLLENVKASLEVLKIPVDNCVAYLSIYQQSETATQYGRINFMLEDLLAAATKINKGLSKIRKLEKRIEKLEKKKK